MDIGPAVVSLSALAHQGRLEVFRLLIKAGTGGLPAGEIARRLQVPPSSLSSNLNLLSHAGLVQARREGRSIIYTADYDTMGRLLGFLLEDCCGGAPEVCAPLAVILDRVNCCAPEITPILETL